MIYLHLTIMLTFISIESSINIHKIFFLRSGFNGSSLIYNTSARHEQHECETSDGNVTRVRHERQECETSATRTTRVRHE